MKKTVFKRFILTTNLDEYGVDLRHLSRTYVQIVGDTEVFSIHGRELCDWQAEALLSGDEEEILDTIKSIWESRQYHTNLLKDFYYGVV